MTDATTTAAPDPTTTESVAAPVTSAPVSTLLDTGEPNSSTPPANDAAKPDDAQAGSEEGQQQDEQPKGAPAEYEDFTLPEGLTLDPEIGTDLKALAKELDLTQAGAQKVAELGAQLSQKWTSQLQAQIDATSDAWSEAAKADKEIGGDKLTANLGLAKTALDKFGTPELRSLLNESRLANNPEMIRLLVRVGQATSDDSRVTTGKPPAASGGRSAASVLFPSQQG